MATERYAAHLTQPPKPPLLSLLFFALCFSPEVPGQENAWLAQRPIVSKLLIVPSSVGSQSI